MIRLWPHQQRMLRSTHDAPLVLDLRMMPRSRITPDLTGISVGPISVPGPSLVAFREAMREATGPMVRAVRALQPPTPEPTEESPQDRALRLRQNRNTGPNRNPFEKRTRT